MKLWLGNWFGVPVYMHWTLALMFGIFFGFSPQTCLAIFILFGIVALHEVGHCVAGKWLGHEAEEILLTPIGGIAILFIPKQFSHELIIALAGPAVNVLFIPILFGLSKVHDFFVLVAYWNLLMLGFNLIPAFPMDGGRVGRAILNMIINDYYKATLVAGRVGQVLSVGFGVWGVVYFMPMLVLIACFVFFAAEAEIEEAKL